MSNSKRSVTPTIGHSRHGTTWNPRYRRLQMRSARLAWSWLRPMVILQELQASAVSSSAVKADFVQRAAVDPVSAPSLQTNRA